MPPARNYSHEQVSLFDDVLRRLTADVEVKARAKLAERLAGMHSAPPKLVRTFAFDDAIEIGSRMRAVSSSVSWSSRISSWTRTAWITLRCDSRTVSWDKCSPRRVRQVWKH